MKTNFLFRVDASQSIGSGHVMRCLTFAHALRKQGAEVSFACRIDTGDMRDVLAEAGFTVHALQSSEWRSDADATLGVIAKSRPIDWLVVDHYALGIDWERRLRLQVDNLLVIDDCPLRDHDCDLLLDPNFSESGASRWMGRVPFTCRVLAGLRFALLREEFVKARGELRSRDGQIGRLLICFGGADPDGAALIALDGLILLARQGLLKGVVFDVVTGGSNPHKSVLAERSACLPGATFTETANDMAARMAAADLALGAGGGMIWERCCLGLPALVAVLADNQAPAVADVARLGAHWSLGKMGEFDAHTIADRVADLLEHPEVLVEAGRRGMDLIGEPGFIQRPLDWLQ